MTPADALTKHYEPLANDLGSMARIAAAGVVNELSGEDLPRARAAIAKWVSGIFVAAFDRAVAANIRHAVEQVVLSPEATIARKQIRTPRQPSNATPAIVVGDDGRRPRRRRYS